MMKHLPAGQYCIIYGKTLSNRVMENFLEASHMDISAMSIVDLTGISKPKVYQIIEEFMKKGYVVKSRMVGRTQMYKLNKENVIVKIFMRNFSECLKMTTEQYTTKSKDSNNIKTIASTKTF